MSMATQLTSFLVGQWFYTLGKDRASRMLNQDQQALFSLLALDSDSLYYLL